MKKVGLLILIIAGIAILGYGKIHWQSQIAAITDENRVSNQSTESKEPEPSNTNEINLDYAQNLPQEIIEMLKNEETVNLTLIPRNQQDWAEGLKNALMEAYGTRAWNINIITYDDQTTTDITQDDRFLNLQTDMIVYELPLLTDNLSVDMTFDETLDGTLNLINTWSEATIILHPSNPVHQAVNYPIQVETFAENMINQGHTYLNHWEAWPDFMSDEIVPYLDEEGMRPSEAGATLWTEYLTNYFIKK